ncbi:hypothetical protein D3C76_494880 [compost metagenome]
MGLDYSYVLVINKDKREELIRFVQENGRVEGSDCFSIHVEVDSFVLKYLEGGYDWKPHYDKEEIQQQLTSDHKARIGSIDYTEMQPKMDSDILIVSFTAVTSDMSLLFQDSMAVRNWFIVLSQKVNSMITYIDLESEGHRIICLNGASTFLEFKGEGFFRLEKKDFLGIMDEFVQHLRAILTSYRSNYKFETKYSVVIKKDQIAKLRRYMESKGNFDDNGQVAIHFDLDSTLLRYLENGHGEQEYGIPQGVIPSFRRDMVYKHIEADNKVKIGKIDYVQEDLGGEEDNVLVSFVPKKWSADRLFSESLSIRNWFIELSKEVSARMTFQSLWTDGYGHRIIYYQGEQIHVEFRGHYDLEIETFSHIYRVFSMYSKHFEDE